MCSIVIVYWEREREKEEDALLARAIIDRLGERAETKEGESEGKREEKIGTLMTKRMARLGGGRQEKEREDGAYVERKESKV